MWPVSKNRLNRSAFSAYLCICVALLLPLALSIWGAYRDVDYLQKTLLQSEIQGLRSHAERTAGRIERDLEDDDPDGLNNLDLKHWLENHWQEAVVHDPGQSYAALVMLKGPSCCTPTQLAKARR